jgi:hypothetical protein
MFWFSGYGSSEAVGNLVDTGSGSNICQITCLLRSLQ